MDMNKILQNFEDAAKGEYAPSKQESSDMKMILESFNEVAAHDAKTQQLDEIASVSVSGETADEVAQLVRLMNDAGAPEAAPVGAQPTTMHEPSPCGGPPDMPPKDTMITPKMMDDFDTEEEPVAEDDWDNAPEETYDDHETMTLDLSGGINRRKNSYKRAEPGDNPMAVESSLKEELSKMLKKKMSEKKDQDGDGDNDFDDVQIARMKASGMSHDEAVAKVKGKKAPVKDKKKPVKESENATDGKTETIDIGWGEEFEVKHTPQGRLLIGEDISAEVYRPGHGGENAERFIDFVYNMDTKKVIEWPEKMSYEYEELDKEAFLEVVDWIATKVEMKLKSSGTKFESENSKKIRNFVAKNAQRSGAGAHVGKEYKTGRKAKHKGKQYESAPVFDRYVKPFLNKTPRQIVEFYDTEAYAIIDRLSRESRELAKENVNTRVHDSIVGKLRENLSVLSETKLDEMRRRRSSFDIGRSSWDPNMYSPRGDLGAADKRDFKRREMEVELGDEEPNNYAVSIGGKPWKVFRSQRQAEKAAATIKRKYGKDTNVYQTAAPPSS